MSAASVVSYEGTVADIEASIGKVPGFMEAIPEDALVAEWPEFK